MADSGRERRQAAKKRKRGGRGAGAEPESHDPPTAVSNGDAGVSSPKKAKKAESGKPDVWTRDFISTLVERVGESLPADDVWKYSTQAERMSWDEVAFGDFTSEECKTKWLDIITKLRRFRTMTELVHDAREWCKMPWNSFGKKTSHPDMPKKPLTPYFKFFVTNRVKSAAQNPDMSMTDLSKLLSAKFRTLTPEKKQHYVDQYNRENEEYKVAMEKFRKEHPEACNPTETSLPKPGAIPTIVPVGGVGKPPKATTPMMIYINAKAQEQIEKGTNLTRKELYEHYREKWSKLEDKKKLKYINKGIEAKATFDTEMAEYCRNNPGFVPKDVKTFLCKAEQKIHDHYSGKPEKPPPNGYGLYTATIMSQLQAIPAAERMMEISRRWKQFSDGEKAAYNKEAEKRNREYKLQFQAYLDQLSPEDRERIESECNNNKSKKSPAAAASAAAAKTKKAAETPATQVSPDKPQKPVAAMFIFIEDKEAVYKTKHPRMASKELKQLMIKEYNCLSEREKNKYKKLEQERKTQIASIETTSMTTKAAKMHFPGEPKKPPTSAYQMFSAEMLSKLVDVPAKDRMTEVSRRWAATNANLRKGWQKKKDTVMAQYVVDLEKFKKTLSPKDLKKYEDYQKTKGKKTVVKQNMPAVEEKAASSSGEEESDESEEESSEEESEEEESEVEESGEEESEEAEEETKQMDKDLVQQNGKQVKGKLNTNEVYESDTTDDSDESTESSDSDSNDA